MELTPQIPDISIGRGGLPPRLNKTPQKKK